MRITFVNHASFILEHGPVRLICDPWLEGTAFDQGWSLLSRTRLRYEEFDRITHIWFSHEHPDHFAPPVLLRIAPETRARITVLFQETVDHKVVDFCRKAGFKELVELKQGTYQRLAEDLEIRCDPYTDGDSYAVFRTSARTLLNLNDCVVDTPERARALARAVGKVDVLFTQFGYANKVGNADQPALRQAASREKLERIRHQVAALRPRTVVPFASFVRFCHAENTYMNDGILPINVVDTFIRDALGVQSVVLYPGDVWNVDDQHDNKAALEEYAADQDASTHAAPLSSTGVDEATLVRNSVNYMERLRASAPRYATRIAELEAHVHVVDLGTTYVLSGKHGLAPRPMDQMHCDVALSSEALNYCFLHLWGGDTLNVNARFQVPAAGDHRRFRLFGAVASAANRNEQPTDLFPTMFDRISRKLRRVIGG